MPLLHYLLFGLLPLLVAAALYQLIDSWKLRLVSLATAVVVHRFTYGLNLFDFTLAAASLIFIKSLGDAPFRNTLRFISGGLLAASTLKPLLFFCG